ncbi:MAG TPA: hypothetical protein VJQ56_13200, partial [Blastocatellia bacterium]|nr:hypothetical protein [Blastocatellia bacterium]
GRPVLVRSLLALRALPSTFRERARPQARALTLETFLKSGFVLLSESKDEEIVIGLVGKFWTPTGCLEHTDAASFKRESRAGLARAVWNFALEPGPSGTRVVTETRVQCTDGASRRLFRAYWLLVRPFSGLLRRYMLRELRQATETRFETISTGGDKSE